MARRSAMFWTATLAFGANCFAQVPSIEDARLQRVAYDAGTVVTVHAKRGVTTHVVLDAAEHIEFVATGVGSDCGRDEDSWCVIAPKNGTQFFVKPKSTAVGANNVAVATDRRAYSLRFEVVGEAEPRPPVYRLTFLYPSKADTSPAAIADMPPSPVLFGPSEAELLRLRLQQSPTLVNGEYSIAIGKHSEDIAPTLVWDDGRFTFFEFPANREIPTVFQLGEDGAESIVNARMEGDFLVADRVARQYYLRLDRAVVRVWNDAFDVNGVPPANGTTVPGVERVLRVGADHE